MGDFRLPSGKYTRSEDRYIREWRRLTRPLRVEVGWNVIAFDPGVLAVDTVGGCIDLTVQQVRDIASAVCIPIKRAVK